MKKVKEQVLKQLTARVTRGRVEAICDQAEEGNRLHDDGKKEGKQVSMARGGEEAV